MNSESLHKKLNSKENNGEQMAAAAQATDYRRYSRGICRRSNNALQVRQDSKLDQRN